MGPSAARRMAALMDSTVTGFSVVTVKSTTLTFGVGETVKETPHPKIRRATRPPIDAGWLDDELGELERLVEAGDTLEVVAKLASMMREPRRVAAESPAPSAP